MKPKRALDLRVTLQEPVETRDAAGEILITWHTVAQVWADIRDLSGREISLAKSVQSESVRRITIRWRAGVTARMRIQYEGDTMVITAPPRMVGTKEYLELDCSEGLRHV